MKSKKRRLLLSVASLSAMLSVFILVSPSVFAESACYIRHGSDPNVTTTRPDCGGEPNFNEIYKNIYGSDKVLEDQKCYIIAENQNGITPGDPYGSDICNAAEGARSDKAAPAPATPAPTPGGGTAPSSGGGNPSQQESKDNGGPEKADAKVVDCTKDAKANPDKCIQRSEEQLECNDVAANPGNCNIIKIANDAIKILSGLVGVTITAMIIAGGVRYSMAAGDPQAVAKAKDMIRNAIIALVVYILLLAFLNWVVPGGIL